MSVHFTKSNNQGRLNSIIAPPGKAVHWPATYTTTRNNKNVKGRSN